MALVEVSLAFMGPMIYLLRVVRTETRVRVRVEDKRDR